MRDRSQHPSDGPGFVLRHLLKNDATTGMVERLRAEIAARAAIAANGG